MTAVGIKRVSAVIEAFINDEPAVVGFLAPSAYVNMTSGTDGRARSSAAASPDQHLPYR